ncbi:CinA family protein [Actinoplanes sp. NPDC048967]|uniref:CinA family protein n=1 Tax=Actinoplanes sp. NPDC048967 TaxID=3155269 RepID=UPI0033E55697
MSEGRIDDPGVAAAAVVHALVDRHQTLSVAESLTGGLLAATIVEIAGVSAVFKGGMVVYATELKHTLAGVPRQLLDERGPVDPDVALALAEGVRERCGSDWGLATTGVAGPEPQDGKPVGMVFVAAAGPGGATVQELNLPGSRQDVRVASVTSALSLLVAQLRGSTAGIAG